MTNPIFSFRITPHAKEEMRRRGIDENEITGVLEGPEQEEIARQGRVIYQSRVEYGDPPKQYLLRVFVDVDRDLPEVVTVYRTSKIAKYWRTNG